MNDLNYHMEGKYVFRYLREGENPDDSEENLAEVD